MTKTIASTLSSLTDNETILAIFNPDTDIIQFASELEPQYLYDLFSRKPSPVALRDGFTDLDLATFLDALAQRHAVIAIPRYKSMRERVADEDRVVFNTRRSGKINHLVSNEKVWSFCVNISDSSVIDVEGDNQTPGGATSFAITDVTGDFHKGWERIEFIPTAKENNFLTGNQQWVGNNVNFNSFVHPNRWVSFYGLPYFILKAMISRLEQESSHLRKQIKLIKEKIGCDVKKAGGKSYSNPQPPQSSPVKLKDITVDSIEAEIDYPDDLLESQFKPYKASAKILGEITERERIMQHVLLPRFRFKARVIEFAFLKHGFANGAERFPAWISGAAWERDFRFARQRAAWNRLVYTQPGVGELGIALRYRHVQRNESVVAS